MATIPAMPPSQTETTKKFPEQTWALPIDSMPANKINALT